MPDLIDSGADFGTTENEDSQPPPARRYLLWRIWGSGKSLVTFVMLNPSTAGTKVDDPTIRRCAGFARSWGFDGFYVINLCSLRTPSPKILLRHHNPCGLLDAFYWDIVIKRSSLVVAAWGANAQKLEQKGMTGFSAKLRELCRKHKKPLGALKLTKRDDPCHPLYLPADLRPREWQPGRLGETLC